MHENTIILCWTGPNLVAPGKVARKAVMTTSVFPRTQEMQRAKITPKAVWRSMQDQPVGSAMKVRGQRKQRKRESSNRALSSALLALTNGVCLNARKMAVVVKVRKAPNKDTAVRMIPNVSLKDRTSTDFNMHLVLSSLDQYS